MKRHISVFAFLLGAFAAIGPFASLTAAQTVNVYCEYDNGPVNDGGTPWESFSTDGGKQYGSTVTIDSSMTFTVHPRNGWEIEKWSRWNKADPRHTTVKVADAVSSYTWKTSDHSSLVNPSLCMTFKPIDYRLDFATGGGSGKMSPYEKVCYTNVFDLPHCTFTRTGWAFSCWSNSVNGATFPDMATVSGEILCISNENRKATLTALWENMTFAVTLDRAGGSGGATSVNAICNEMMPNLTSASLPKRIGYDFDGYFEAPDGAGEKYYDAAGTGLHVWLVKGTGTLYAKWKAKVGAIGYETDNGHFPTEPVVTWTYDQAIDVDSPQKDQSVFDGWKVTKGIEGLQCWYSADGWVTSNQVTTALQICKPANGKLSFVNFNASGSEVNLTAVWSGQKSLTVRAVPEKGGTVTGGGSYDKGSRVDISVKPNDGYSFIRWADDESAPAKRTVTVENDVTYTALCTGNLYEVSFIAHGGQIDSESRSYRFGEPFGDLPQTSRDGYSFSGWFSKSSGGKQYTAETWFDIDVINPEISDLTMHAQWTPIPTYHVAFVGGADATGEMDIQTICRDRPTALTSNAFVRTGYTFLGWAETNDLWHVKYADGTNVLNIAAADATNELHAVWSANRYTVAFDGNGATEVAMAPRTLTYGKPENLPPNTFARGELWTFGGWSNEVDGTVFADGALVSNLCTVADGTNTLHAVWRSNLTDLSRAMHCDTLIWTDVPANSWTANFKAEGYKGSGSEAQATTVSRIGGCATDYLTATLKTDGTLSFCWRTDRAGATLNLYCDVNGEPSSTPAYAVSAVNDQWQKVEWPLTLPEKASYQVVKFELRDESAGAQISIDQMKWTPGGREPKDGEDNVDISSAGISADGKSFSLSFTSKAEFDYNLLTNANLLIDSWGKMGETKEGTGKPITFEPEIIEGQPQLFYKVETIQKK